MWGNVEKLEVIKMRANRFPLASLSLAVLAAISAQPTLAQQEDEQLMEEVVATGTRLKGSATAVMQERKEQAFVADIMGAEQIARTGDSDAAGALRRVTGLTLVDGKFIYVRGLGERYSSTQLNGATVPSPDPTRSVIPLDLFPSDIIESLSVQKSYSPSMPAHFGGGNVNIRLKTIPSDFLFNVSAKVGGNSENFDDGLTYNGGGKDWQGRDDGTRAAPASIQQLWDNRTFLNDISIEENRKLAVDLNRDFDARKKSIGPDTGFNVALGDNFESDSGDWRYGFLTTVGYTNEWDVKEKFEGQDFRKEGDGYVLVRGFDEVQSTEHSVKWSGMLNLGLDFKRQHRIDISSLILHDTEDKIEEKFGNTNNALLSDGIRVRDVEVIYEERELVTNQIKGMHTFPDLWFAGLDWQYSKSCSNRYAPGNVETRFFIEDANKDGKFSVENEIALRRGNTASRYNFQRLQDEVENYGFNLSLPISLDKWEIELKSGANFIKKERNASNRRFDLNTLAITGADLKGRNVSDILTDSVLQNSPLTDRILRDTTIAGDDYQSAQVIDAYYVEGDFFFDNQWRFSGGVRWEDYKQATFGFNPRTGQFDDVNNRQELLEKVVNEDDFYPALAMTYTIDPEMQLRLSYGETVVRPDLREIARSTFLDPLTGDPVRGTPGLKTTAIKNYDARWEWYMDSGDNLSVGLFYKDMQNPIESVQSPGQDGPPLIVMANATEGSVYGVELEFLKGLEFLGGVGNNLFVSGNVTLSDSEITLNTKNIVAQTGVSTAITHAERRLTGHSKYVVNLQLGYDSDNGNHSASVVYNVFGDRIILPGIDGFEDTYEQPFHSLDVVYTYYPDFNSQVKLKLQNILDQKKKLEFDNQLRRSETKGIGFTLSYKYEF